MHLRHFGAAPPRAALEELGQKPSKKLTNGRTDVAFYARALSPAYASLLPGKKREKHLPAKALLHSCFGMRTIAFLGLVLPWINEK